MKEFILGRESFPIRMDNVVQTIRELTGDLPSELYIAGVNVLGDVVLHYVAIPLAEEVGDPEVGEVEDKPTDL